MRRPRHLGLTLTLIISAACGEEEDGAEQNDPAALHAALEEARAAQAQLCARVDSCYPELVESDYCNYPTGSGEEGSERAWPAAEVDPCWDVLFEHDPGAVLDYLSCTSKNTRAAAACWKACPTGGEAAECAALLDDDENCDEALYRRIPEHVIEAYSTCEEERLPG